MPVKSWSKRKLPSSVRGWPGSAGRRHVAPDPHMDGRRLPAKPTVSISRRWDNHCSLRDQPSLTGEGGTLLSDQRAGVPPVQGQGLSSLHQDPRPDKPRARRAATAVATPSARPSPAENVCWASGSCRSDAAPGSTSDQRHAPSAQPFGGTPPAGDSRLELAYRGSASVMEGCRNSRNSQEREAAQRDR